MALSCNSCEGYEPAIAPTPRNTILCQRSSSESQLILRSSPVLLGTYYLSSTSWKTVCFSSRSSSVFIFLISGSQAVVIFVLLSACWELISHGLNLKVLLFHEIDGVRKEKERLTAASDTRHKLSRGSKDLRHLLIQRSRERSPAYDRSYKTGPVLTVISHVGPVGMVLI